MNLFSTKYRNNIRTVSGTPTIYKDDVSLECNTSSAAVIINLLEIPENFWDTSWRMYIMDASNNAATNNITINAPVGFKINGQASLTISTNGGGCILKIANNTNYIVQYNASSTSINGHTIQDEGVSLPQRNFLDFVGGGVSVTDIAGKTTANIAIQDFDTGWIDLLGFGHMTNKPQYRVINRILQFRGTAVIPLSNGAAVIPYVDENSYINSAFNTPWTSGGTGSVQTFTAASAPFFVLGFNSSGLNSASGLIASLPSVINNANRYTDNTCVFSNIIATRRVRAQGSTAHGVSYNVPIYLFFQTNGSILISMLNNQEDGNWNNQDKTDSRRILGTNAVIGERYAEFGTLNYGNAAPNTDVVIKGISNNLATGLPFPDDFGFKHAITVDITNVNTLGGFQIILDGLSMNISRSTPLTTIHA